MEEQEKGQGRQGADTSLYTLDDAVESIKLFRSVKYDEEVQLTDTLKVRFNDAGHILGSSILEIWLKDNGRESKLVFTGDLGNKGLPILRIRL